jgi:hypothetical protein
MSPFDFLGKTIGINKSVESLTFVIKPSCAI